LWRNGREEVSEGKEMEKKGKKVERRKSGKGGKEEKI
jgi:hypothetical protein